MRGLAAHTASNLRPILEVLGRELRDRQNILEIGSGNGQHATEICASLKHLNWQTSDRIANHPSIQAWLGSADISNVQPPLALDVLTDTVSSDVYDAVFSANTAHIMGIKAVEKMFEIVSSALRSQGIFCLYGPFRRAGRFNTESNARFHHSLQARDTAMGIRHLEALDAFADVNGLQRTGLYAMPSNNMLVLWTRAEEAS